MQIVAYADFVTSRFRAFRRLARTFRFSFLLPTGALYLQSILAELSRKSI
jgi:hypothetical protein